MNRTQRILAIVLAIQVVLSVVTFWPRTARSSGGGVLFPDLNTADVVAMTLTDGKGKAVELRQVGGSWVLPEADDYPAKAETITAALAKVVALDTKRLVTRTSSSHKRLQVAADSFAGRVDLETASGAKYTLYLGSSPSYGSTHVRAEGSDATYLANDLTTWELGAEAGSWVDTAYFSVAQDTLSTVTVKNAKGTLTFSRNAEGNWTLAELPAGEELAQDAANQAMTRVTSVTLLAPLGKTRLPAYGLDSPLAVVTLRPKEGEPITLLAGAQDATDQSYVVHVSTSPYYVRVSQYYMKSLVENGLAEYLAPKETPTPQS
jgi:hypothetical protein